MMTRANSHLRCLQQLVAAFLSSSSLILMANVVVCQVQEEEHPESYYNRYGYGYHDPNKLLNGFFPVWGIILLSMAG